MPVVTKSPRRLLPALACVALACVALTGTSAASQQTGTADTIVRVLKTPLAPVVTTASELEEKLTEVGFYRRREHSGIPASQFMTRQELDRRGALDLSQHLRRIKGRGWGCADGVIYVDGVLLAASLPAVAADSVRMIPSEMRGKSAPFPVVDNPMPKASALDLIPMNMVGALEIFTGPSEIPVEYNAAFRQARCVVLVWTR